MPEKETLEKPAKVKVEKAEKNRGKDEEMLDILKGLANMVSNIDKRVKRIETGGVDDFKAGVKTEDVDAARNGRSTVDPKVTKIVDELLGEDFGVEMAGYNDRPGFLFTVIVPRRLSDNIQGTRPVFDPSAPGKYLKDPEGNVILEDYYPEDRRSRSLSNVENYDALREHCERVRSYIVSSFQKQSKPLPEFKVK